MRFSREGGITVQREQPFSHLVTVEELTATNQDMQARTAELQELAVLLEAERRTAEGERERLRAVLSGIADAVMVVGPHGEPILTNTAFQLMFGDAGALIPQNEEGQALPRDDWPQRRAARGETFSMSFTLPSEEGFPRWFEANGQPLEATDISQAGVVVIRDITDRSLRRLTDEFVSLATHELRTPLTSMQLYLEMVQHLLSERGEDPLLPEYTNLALAQLHRLSGLVNDLADARRLQTGTFVLQLNRLDLVDVVRRAREASQMLDPGRRMSLDAPARPVFVDGDPRRLEQVFQNLLANALTCAPESVVDVRVRRARKKAVVELQDYGPGIPPDQLPTIFDRSFRGWTERRAPAGLGLGLFISRDIVQRHGGRIGVESEVGKGTTFSVWLPLATGGTAAPWAGPTRSAGRDGPGGPVQAARSRSTAARRSVTSNGFAR